MLANVVEEREVGEHRVLVLTAESTDKPGWRTSGGGFRVRVITPGVGVTTFPSTFPSVEEALVSVGVKP